MNGQKPLKPLHITLWVVQGLLSASFVWASAMKLFSPVDQLTAMWTWIA